MVRVLTLLTLLTAPTSATRSATASTRTGVLIHGYHCNAGEWEKVVYGDPTAGLLGRVPMALLVAAQCGVPMEDIQLIFGTGASIDDKGLFESEAELALAIERCPRLARDFPAHFQDVDLAALERLLENAIADTTSTTTFSELREAAKRFKATGHCQRIYLVTSPTHLPRVMRDAPGAFMEERLWPLPAGGLLLGVPSATSWSGCKASDVAVIEPPHLPAGARAHEPAWPTGDLALHRLVDKALRVLPARRGQVAKGLRLLLSEGE